MSTTILVVEPQSHVSAEICRHLRNCGLDVMHVTCGNDALHALAAVPRPSLVLLDLELPDMPGLDLCRAIRRDPRTAKMAILMTSERGDETDRVVGLELGADDYVTKPYSVREVGLRIKALLRRQAAPDALAGAEGGIRIDKESGRVWAEDREIMLTSLQFRLLWTLWAARDQVLGREQLLRSVWGDEPPESARAIDTHVQRLRSRLGRAGFSIETLRGVGYRLNTSRS